MIDVEKPRHFEELMTNCQRRYLLASDDEIVHCVESLELELFFSICCYEVVTQHMSYYA